MKRAPRLQFNHFEQPAGAGETLIAPRGSVGLWKAANQKPSGEILRRYRTESDGYRRHQLNGYNPL